MIVHTYSSLGLSSTTVSSKRKRGVKIEENEDEEDGEGEGEGEEFAKLRYGDSTLLLTIDNDGRPRFAVRPLFTRFENEMQPAQR